MDAHRVVTERAEEDGDGDARRWFCFSITHDLKVDAKISALTLLHTHTFAHVCTYDQLYNIYKRGDNIATSGRHTNKTLVSGCVWLPF